MYRRSIQFILLCAILGKTTNGQTHVQTNTLFETGAALSNTVNQTFTATSTGGNLIVVHLDWDDQTHHVTSLTDNKGNTYTKIMGPTNWNGVGYRAELWYAYNIIVTPNPTTKIMVTATLNGTPNTFFQIYISEFSGIAGTAPLDKSAVATGTTPVSPTAVSSGSQTISYSHELIYGASIGSNGILSVGGTFSTASSVNQNLIEYKNVATAGAYNATWSSTGTSNNWIAQMATFISTISVLPVDFTSFTGRCENGRVVLKWTTASETDNDHFTIEQSADGASWMDIGTVKGAGTSAQERDYAFIAAAGPAMSYYRIKQTDMDGQSTYSTVTGVGVCTVNGAAVSPEVTIYPNPSRGTAVNGKIGLWGPYMVFVYDNAGKLVARATGSGDSFSLDLSTVLPAGMYYLRVQSTETGSSVVKSFTVVH